MADDLELFLGDSPGEEETTQPTLAPRSRFALRLASSALLSLRRFGALEVGQPEASPATARGDPFARAARSALTGDVRVVVYGHTHEAMIAELAEGIYVNSGAWANLVRLPADTKRDAVVAWLEGIADNTFERTSRPTYVLVEPAEPGVTVSLNLWTDGRGRPLWQKRISP